MSAPAFTIITKALDEEAMISDAIRSALAQTREDFELIIVDDGSTDRTPEIVRRFSSEDERVRLISHPVNRGVAAAMNTGVHAARGHYVSLLDADDLYMPTYLERMGETLESDSRAGFAYTSAWWFDEAGNRFFRRTTSDYMGAPSEPPTDPQGLIRSLLGGNWLFGLTMMRRSAVLEAGGFNESLFGAEDYDMWLRLLAAGHAGLATSGRLCVQRDRATSLSKETSGMLTALREVYRTAAEDLGLPPDLVAAARERESAMAREIEAAASGHPRSAAQGLRRGAGAARRRLFARRIWLAAPPGEVVEAFPWIFKAGEGTGG